jgi:hypothetical protein
MSKRTFLAAALVIMAAFGLPAQACKTRPATASLCTVVPHVADVRDVPNGRVTSDAAGIVRVAGQSKDGLWARVQVPCIGFMGWIARKDLACGGTSASAHEPAK